MRKRNKPMAVPSTEAGECSVSVRKIDNGYIARHSSSDGKGNYKSKEVYHDKKPVLGLPAPEPKRKKKTK